MAESIPPDVKELLNEFINVYDPPKDLTEHKTDAANLAGLSATQKNNLRNILKDIFFPGKAAHDDMNPVQDPKDRLKSEFTRSLGGDIPSRVNNTKVLREKHSSGHDPRPDGLYVSYDAGPKDLVSNAQFLITPGVILDPATKAKDGTLVNLVTSAHDYKTLNKDRYITPIGFTLAAGPTITGDVKMTVQPDGNYKIEIPTKYGPLTSVFTSDKFTPQSAYFKGNETKNRYIKTNLDDSVADAAKKKEIQFYLLAKELGDTLQVQWVNSIVDNSEPGTILIPNSDPPRYVKYTKGNVVVSTNDTVVWLRCIVNSVPVMFTNKGKTNYYRSIDADATAQAIIKKAFIENIRKEVVTHNLSVIETINGVINLGFGAGNIWVNGSQYWYTNTPETPRDRAIAYLRTIKLKLENVNKDYSMQIEKQNDIEDAKRLAAKAHFLNPFTWYKSGGFYKTNNKVTNLLADGTVKFYAKEFTPSRFPSPAIPATFARFFIGGRRSANAKKTRTRAAASDANVSILLAEAFEEWRETTPSDIVLPPTDIAKARSDSTTADQDIPNFNTFKSLYAIWQKNNIDKLFFLYLFVRDYLPQIFTYAAMVKSSLVEIHRLSTAVAAAVAGHEVNDRVVTREEIDKAAAIKEICRINLANFNGVDLDLWRVNHNVEYYLENNEFVTLADIRTQEVIDASHARSLDQTLQAITLASYFAKDFPLLCKGEVASFLNYFDETHADRKKAFTQLDEDQKKYLTNTYITIQEVELYNQGGGGGEGKSSIDPINFIAMDNYEIYYSLAIKGSYTNHDVTQEEFVKALEKAREEISIQTVRAKKITPNRATVKKNNASTPQINAFKLAELLRGRATGLNPQNLADEKGLYNSLTDQRLAGLVNTGRYRGIGGSRRRKTQKKKKQGRKTRKGRGKK